MTTLQQLSNSQSSPEVPINENAETLSAAAIYGKRHPVTTGLTWGYYGGLYAGNTVADGTVTLTNNADNYVVVLRSSGVVSTSTTSVNSLNTAYAKLYKLTTLSGVVTVAVDQRMDGNGVLMSGVGVGGAGTVTNTAGVLTASALMVGNAAADAKVLASLGTTTTVLHGNAAGLPTFGAVSLTSDVTGVLPIANFATGAPTGSKFVRDDGVLAVPAGIGGNAQTANPLSQFAATTSAQLAGVMSDETGTGALVFASAPTLANPVVGTQAANDNSTKAASTAYVDGKATPVLIQLACSDETTALTTGTAKITFRTPYAFTLTDVRASVTTAPTGATLLTVDVKKAGASVFSTKLTFDAAAKTTTTAATQRVISAAAIADDAEITVDVNAIGSTTAGTGLKVTLIGTKP